MALDNTNLSLLATMKEEFAEAVAATATINALVTLRNTDLTAAQDAYNAAVGANAATAQTVADAEAGLRNYVVVDIVPPPSAYEANGTIGLIDDVIAAHQANDNGPTAVAAALAAQTAAENAYNFQLAQKVLADANYLAKFNLIKNLCDALIPVQQQQ